MMEVPLMEGPWQLLLLVTVLLTLASVVGVAVVIYAVKPGGPSRGDGAGREMPGRCGRR